MSSFRKSVPTCIWVSTPPEFNAEVRLRCDALLRHKGCWSQVAREYLEQLGETVDVRKLIADYHQKITSFYNWFANRQREIHAAEVAYLNRVREEMQRLGRPFKEPAVEEVPPLVAQVGHDHDFPREQIELLAYYMYLDEGKQDGRDKMHWQTAIQRLRELKSWSEAGPI